MRKIQMFLGVMLFCFVVGIHGTEKQDYEITITTTTVVKAVHDNAYLITDLINALLLAPRILNDIGGVYERNQISSSCK